MNRFSMILALVGLGFTANAQTKFQPQDTEFYEPKIRVVTTQANAAPSDAIVLFDGSNLNEWVSEKDKSSAPQWTIKNGVLTVTPKTGGIQTKRKFGDMQLHIEWKSPEVIKGEGQGRGNSGLFLSDGAYEIQILDRKSTRLNSSHVKISYAVFC